MKLIILATGVLALLFAGALFERFRHSNGSHLLAWGLGALFYGLGAWGEVVNSLAFNAAGLRAWYLSGAMLAAPWLGQGTVNLLVRKGRTAAILRAALILFSLLAFQLVWSAPLDLSGGFDPAQSLSAQYRQILDRDGLTVALTITLNIYGTLTLAGGAIYSAYLLWRKRSLLHRAAGNVLIAVGALLPASGGTSLAIGGGDWHSLSLFLGVILLFAGYLVATPPKKDA